MRVNGDKLCIKPDGRFKPKSRLQKHHIMVMPEVAKRPTATRWQQALDAGAAPMVVLQATHTACLRIVKLADLKRYVVDLV